MSPNKIEIVIASYQENVWFIPRLEEFGFKVTLYNANDGNIRCFQICPITKEPISHKQLDSIVVPNTCREASQWLHHMIERRGSYAPFTLFMQADLGASYGAGMQMGVDTEGTGAHLKQVYQLALWLELVSEKSNFLPFPSRAPVIRYLTKGEQQEFTKYYPAPLNVPGVTMSQPAGGQFIASAAFLDRIPLDHLKRMMGECHKNPAFARWAEYTWPTLLDSCFDVFPLTQKQAESPKKKANE